MHPNNPHTEGYNFSELTKSVPELKPYVFVNNFGNETIKFSDAKAVKLLNKALLKSDYKINFWEIPDNYLCPPIPGRLDYLLHLKDILGNGKKNVLDIGTGSNLIYPLLGSQHLNWIFTGSEVDKTAFENANNIIINNGLKNSIEVRFQKYKSKILDNIITPNDNFDALVCNPPFFKSAFDAAKKNERKNKNLKLNPKEKLNFGGQSQELWCKGGEEAFIKQLVLESTHYKNQVKVFTCLVSQKEHLKNIKRAINKTGATHEIVEMQQGNKLSRFIVWRY